jgi:hypothetical protein
MGDFSYTGGPGTPGKDGSTPGQSGTNGGMGQTVGATYIASFDTKNSCEITGGIGGAGGNGADKFLGFGGNAGPGGNGGQGIAKTYTSKNTAATIMSYSTGTGGAGGRRTCCGGRSRRCAAGTAGPALSDPDRAAACGDGGRNIGDVARPGAGGAGTGAGPTALAQAAATMSGPLPMRRAAMAAAIMPPVGLAAVAEPAARRRRTPLPPVESA